MFTSLDPDPDPHENLCGSETLSWIPVSCRQAGGNGMPRFIFNVVYHQQVRYIGRYDSLRQVISVISTFLPNGWNWITVWDVGFLDSELLHRQFGVRTATLFSRELSGCNSEQSNYWFFRFAYFGSLYECFTDGYILVSAFRSKWARWRSPVSWSGPSTTRITSLGKVSKVSPRIFNRFKTENRIFRITTYILHWDIKHFVSLTGRKTLMRQCHKESRHDILSFVLL